MAVALSCKYWYKQFRNIIVHPMVAFTCDDEWWMFRRGRIYGNECGSEIWDTEFDTIADIMKFKEYFDAYSKNEQRIHNLNFTNNTLLKIRDVNGQETLSGPDSDENFIKNHLIKKFVDVDIIHNTKEFSHSLDERPGNVIKVDIGHSTSPSVVLSIYVDIWGNIQYSYVKCRAANRITFNLKRDPKLFFDLQEILVYTKNSKSVTFPDEAKYEDHRSIRVTYVSADSKSKPVQFFINFIFAPLTILSFFVETYHIQHLIVTKGSETISVVTNDYKKDSLTKIVRLLSNALTGSADRFEMNVWSIDTPLAAQWCEF